MPLEPIPKDGSMLIEPCRHPEHDAPMHIHIPNGMQLRHRCPGCGREIVVRPPQVTL